MGWKMCVSASVLHCAAAMIIARSLMKGCDELTDGVVRWPSTFSSTRGSAPSPSATATQLHRLGQLKWRGARGRIKHL